jgi:hypothetical protein
MNAKEARQIAEEKMGKQEAEQRMYVRNMIDTAARRGQTSVEVPYIRFDRIREELKADGFITATRLSGPNEECTRISW